jgi:hypothetical protein
MEFVAMDILGPLTATERGNRFLLVVTDRFTKLTRAYPLQSTTADMVARTLIERWVAAWYGIPPVLLSENGTQPQLTSSLWYVLAFIEKNLSCSAMVDAERDESLLENCPKPFWVPSRLVFHVCKYLRTKASVMLE